MSGLIRLDALPDVAILVSPTCESFDARACGGTSLGASSRTFSATDSAGEFDRFTSIDSLPPFTVSVLCDLDWVAPAADDFDAFIDHLELATGVIFANGFEPSGPETWSQTTP